MHYSSRLFSFLVSFLARSFLILCLMADPTGKKCALSLCKGKLIVMDGTTQETVFYCAKPKQNKDNEPALAFPVLFNMKEMSPQLQGIIAIELSQLE